MSHLFWSATGTTLFLYLLHKLYQARQSTSFSTRGKVLILECIARALLHRFICTPCLRLKRLYHQCTNGAQQPMHLQDFQDQVGRNWLSSVLGQTVTSVTCHPFAAGQTGVCARLQLTYQQHSSTTASFDDHTAPPSSLVVKMSRPDTYGKLLNQMARLYSECFVYNTTLQAKFQNSKILPTPTCYYSAVDMISKDFLILLSDASNLGRGVHVETQNLKQFSQRIDNRSLTPQGQALRVSSYGTTASLTHHHPNTNVERIPLVVEHMKRVSVGISALHAAYWKDTQVWAMDVHFANLDSQAKVVTFVDSDMVKSKACVDSGLYEGTRPWRNCTETSCCKSVAEYEVMLEETLNYPYMHMAVMKGKPRGQWRDCLTMQDVKAYYDLVGYTLTHGDFHGENILIRDLSTMQVCETGGNSGNSGNRGDREDTHKSILESLRDVPSFVVLDWQVGQIADPVRDIAQLIGTVDLLPCVGYCSVILFVLLLCIQHFFHKFLKTLDACLYISRYQINLFNFLQQF
jgi:hypothetical protein